MNKTQPLPTDAELDTVLCNQWPAFSMQAPLVRVWVRAAMRDALAKWGTPQPTQAQAGAVPLTDKQIRAMAREYPAEDLCGWSYRMGVADTESHHGIKGGQHG